MPHKPHHITLFASGNGSNFEAIAQACADGRLNAEIVLLVCDKPEAYVVKRAEKFNIPVFAFRPKDYASKADYETEIVELLKKNNVDLICLAGYMRLVSEVLLNEFEGKIINIHPSLLPAFKGAHAIEQAFEYGVKITGVTTHFVDKTMDGGTIIEQIPVSTEGLNLQELEEKIHAVEHVLYIQTINQILRNYPSHSTQNSK